MGLIPNEINPRIANGYPGKGKNFSCSHTGKHLESEHYQTPYSITLSLLKRMEYVIDSGRLVHDPACGDGAIIKVLRENRIRCRGTDIVRGKDFFKSKEKIGEIIVTNPPYSGLNKERFVEHGFNLGYDDIFLLMPLGFLQGQSRYDQKIYQNLKKILILTRMPMLKKDVRKDGKFETGMQALAWYWFSNIYGCYSPPMIEWIDCTGLTCTKTRKKQ